MANSKKTTEKVSIPDEAQLKGAISAMSHDEIESILDKLDHAKIADIKSSIAGKKEQIQKKEYAVKISVESWGHLRSYIEESAEWQQSEAIGIIEICKVFDQIEKEGIKDSTIFLPALPLEATHYFLSKTKGRGLAEAKKFMQVWKPIDQAVQSAKIDAYEITKLEKELVAAEQGIGLV